MFRRSSVFLLSIVVLASCATGPTFDQAKRSDLIEANYAGADRLIAANPRRLLNDAPIIVATLVKLDNLSESSNFGRLVSQQVAARFSQLNYPVPELKLRGEIFVRAAQGELLLSRDIQDIVAAHHAQAVVVGTYAVAATYVHVNLELVDAITRQIISAHDYRLPLVPDVRVLLGMKLN